VKATAVSAVVYGIISCWMYVIGMGAAIYTGEYDIAQIMVKAGLGVLIWVEGSSQLWNTDQLCTRDLSPALTGSTLLAWKHDVTQTAAVNAFIEHVCTELDALNHNDNA